MRILFGLHTYLPEGKGGTEMHVHALAKTLGRSHTVRVVAREGDPSKPDYAVTRETYEGVEVARINHLWRDVRSFEDVYKNRRVHELFERELVDFRPDLVHLHHLTGLSTTIVETIKRGGLPLAMTLHDFWTVCPRGQRMTKELDLCENVDRNVCFHCLGGIWPQFFTDFDRQRIELDSRGKLAPRDLAEFDRHMAYVLNLADVLIAPSEFHRERMLDFPLPADRTIALPHGLDHAPFRGVVRAPRPVKRIGYLGSVIPVKGVHVLVEAFNLLKRADLELHVHGESFAFHDDRSYFERLKARAVGRPNVFFHGAYRPVDLPRILANLDVLVVPSLWWESFCLTIREGLMAGVPVVASDLGAMREALDGERNGLLFRPGDPQDLADRLRAIVEDDALRIRLSNRREAVKSIETYAEEILGVYERTMAVSAERAGGLVIAPTHFGEDQIALKVASVTSSDGLTVEAPVPAADGRSALVRMRLKDGSEAVLRVDMERARIVDPPPPPAVDRRAETRAAERAEAERADAARRAEAERAEAQRRASLERTNAARSAAAEAAASRAPARPSEPASGARPGSNPASAFRPTSLPAAAPAFPPPNRPAFSVPPAAERPAPSDLPTPLLGHGRKERRSRKTRRTRH
jgi:glycosyltransferase involved in cell wall biosynthesis